MPRFQECSHGTQRRSQKTLRKLLKIDNIMSIQREYGSLAGEQSFIAGMGYRGGEGGIIFLVNNRRVFPAASEGRHTNTSGGSPVPFSRGPVFRDVPTITNACDGGAGRKAGAGMAKFRAATWKRGRTLGYLRVADNSGVPLLRGSNSMFSEYIRDCRLGTQLKSTFHSGFCTDGGFWPRRRSTRKPA